MGWGANRAKQKPQRNYKQTKTKPQRDHQETAKKPQTNTKKKARRHQNDVAEIPQRNQKETTNSACIGFAMWLLAATQGEPLRSVVFIYPVGRAHPHQA